MSAKYDSKQGFKYYYGNAARDLNQYLPKEESVFALHSDGVETIAQSSQTKKELQSLNVVVENIETSLNQIVASQRHLGFLLQDLKRIIG